MKQKINIITILISIIATVLVAVVAYQYLISMVYAEKISEYEDKIHNARSSAVSVQKYRAHNNNVDKVSHIITKSTEELAVSVYSE